MNWFKVTQLNKHTWQITETLWSTVHCYLLTGAERAVLIDTCSGIGPLAEMVAQLTSLPVTVVNTHGHIDHTGGNGAFRDIRLHPGDAWLMANAMGLSDQEFRESLRDLDTAGGLPPGFKIDQAKPYRGEATAPLTHGEILDLGGVTLEVIHSPGHSPGHVCLWDAAQGSLFTGDLIYPGPLSFTQPGQESLEQQASLNRLQALKPLALWPGHSRLSTDYFTKVTAIFNQLHRQGRLKKNSGLQQVGDVHIEL